MGKTSTIEWDIVKKQNKKKHKLTNEVTIAGEKKWRPPRIRWKQLAEQKKWSDIKV